MVPDLGACPTVHQPVHTALAPTVHQPVRTALAPTVHPLESPLAWAVLVPDRCLGLHQPAVLYLVEAVALAGWEV